MKTDDLLKIIQTRKYKILIIRLFFQAFKQKYRTFFYLLSDYGYCIEILRFKDLEFVLIIF